MLGGTRFIGARLVDALLEEDDEVTVFSRTSPSRAHPRLRHISGDSRIAPGLGALGGAGEYDAAVDFFCMDKRDADAHARWIKPISRFSIMVSSIGVYGPSNDFPAEEEFMPCRSGKTPPALRPAYIAKREAEKSLAAAFGSRLKIIRPAVVLGPGDWTKRLSYYSGRLMDRKGIILYGGGDNLSWTTEGRVSLLIRDLIKRQSAFPDPVYNIAQAQATTFLELLKESARALGLHRFPVLALRKHGLAEPYPEFRDPYGKEASTCGVGKLSSLNAGYTDGLREEWGRLTALTARNPDFSHIPDYGFREREAAFLAAHGNRIDWVET